MTWHWWHVLLSWGVVLTAFAVLAAVVRGRLRAAARRLAVLEKR
ncbi:MAG: hypothetical protein RMK64_03580 [Rhodovarius sp.]|nr:hypothetical protein [Rhodovarius sp.]MCX7931215.1 hypothetical protein [Rhodovarius sp.]MDW8314030.1 hypothetical protein [Rhodovarius sp.]